ncbi:pep-cterm sorting domain-containing protein [Anaeramoeba ignava]|uniref:Pep-cterm sorting domain-containing protein n=1 Tax=Anaeramoeba ignava TaxID=1746090 RepID=A0A9Q0RFR1_ANAIG|nr:pep-cterm sorting domain-containing protein [Anaeramoeba ignava]
MTKRYFDQDKLTQDLRKLLFSTNNLSDFEIIVTQANQTETIFNCHRAILSFRSNYFDGLFRSKMKEYQEGRVFFSDVSPEVMKNILDYIYTGSIEITEENAVEILIKSKQLCIDEIVFFTSNFIQRNINIDNVVEILNIASQFDCDQVFNYCFHFIKDHFQQLIDNIDSNYFHLSEKHLKMFLEQNDLNVEQELDLFYAVLKWSQFNAGLPVGIERVPNNKPTKFSSIFSNVIKKIRFCDIDRNEIKKIHKMDIVPLDIMNAVNILHEISTISPDPNQYKEKLKQLEDEQSQKNSLIFQSRIELSKSSIIKNHKQFIQDLRGWINDDQFFIHMRLGFSGQRDTFSPQIFHDKCDEKGKSLVIIKTCDGYIFGGFTEVGWSKNKEKWITTVGNGGFIRDEHAFIFSLLNPSNSPAQMFPIKKGKEQFAIFWSKNSGPCFGGTFVYGHDLGISGDKFQKCFTNFGHTYQYSELLLNKGYQAEEFLAGSYRNWQIDEIEIFYLF